MYFTNAVAGNILLVALELVITVRDSLPFALSSNKISSDFQDSLSFNIWHTNFVWNNSWPSAKDNARASHIAIKHNGLVFDAAIVYGGDPVDRHSVTWIYNFRLNSWRPVWTAVSGEPLTSINDFSMVSLCERVVMLYRKGLTTNDVWIFNANDESWHQIHFAEQFEQPAARHSHSAVAISDPESKCECKESMIVFGGMAVVKNSENVQTVFRDMWILQCMEDSVSYLWKRIEENSEIGCGFWPAPRFDHVAISAFNRTMMYIYGGYIQDSAAEGKVLLYQELLTYTYASNCWTAKKRIPVNKHGVHHGIYVSLPEPMFLLCCRQPLLIYVLQDERWIEAGQINANGNLPDVTRPAVVSFKAKVFLFGGRTGFFEKHIETFWQLSFIDYGIGIWQTGPKPVLSPLRSRSEAVSGTALGGKAIVVFGGRTDYYPFRASNELWILNMTAMRWSLLFPLPDEEAPVGAKGVVVAESLLLIFGGCTYYIPSKTDVSMNFMNWTSIPKCSYLLWGYALSIDEWMYYKTFNAQPIAPAGRMHHSLVKQSEDTLFLFGGINFANHYHYNLLDDLWMITLSGNTDGNEVGWTRQWTKWSDAPPLSVFGHASAFIGYSMFVYGGLVRAHEPDISRFIRYYACNNTFWEYHSLNRTWSNVRVTSLENPGQRCFHSMVSYGRHVVLTGGCSSIEFITYTHTNGGARSNFPLMQCDHQNHKNHPKGVWTYNVDNGKWQRLTSQGIPSRQLNSPFALIWKSSLMVLGGTIKDSSDSTSVSDAIGLSIMKISCPHGFYSKQFPFLPCNECQLGTFSESANSQNCTTCPFGLTTLHQGSYRRLQCNVCSSKHCGSGSCKVILPGPAAFCECHFGFTKNDRGQCTIATYYIAGSSSIFGIILLVVTIVGGVRLYAVRRQHKQNLFKKDQEIVDLTNVWIVDSRELVLHERIDGDSPGGFGEVYKADYRELPVAVKRLQQLQRIERMELEFEREIEVMRSLRHPNIVLFLGGGRSHDDGCPFLVVEYLPRGALSSLLRNREVRLDGRQKMSFAVDIARGMKFLHNLKPPRIHRDLKSSNCLVSERYTVKVADFGSARLVKNERKRQTAVRGCGPLSLTQPLLEPDYELTTAIGTLQWIAPEILRGQDYGTAVDVHSFAIVLWEICSREIPYDDQSPCSIIDFKDRVVAGSRPTIRNHWPEILISLMRRCWHVEPDNRPTFSEIVEILQMT